eukprot:1523534-Pyramimonas_sp.AAC.1
MHAARQASHRAAGPRLPVGAFSPRRHLLSVPPPRKPLRCPTSSGDFPLSNTSNKEDDDAHSGAKYDDDAQSGTTDKEPSPTVPQLSFGDLQVLLSGVRDNIDPLTTADESTSTFTTVPQYWSNTEQDFWNENGTNGSMDMDLEEVRTIKLPSSITAV